MKTERKRIELDGRIRIVEKLNNYDWVLYNQNGIRTSEFRIVFCLGHEGADAEKYARKYVHGAKRNDSVDLDLTTVTQISSFLSKWEDEDGPAADLLYAEGHYPLSIVGLCHSAEVFYKRVHNTGRNRIMGDALKWVLTAGGFLPIWLINENIHDSVRILLNGIKHEGVDFGYKLDEEEFRLVVGTSGTRPGKLQWGLTIRKQAKLSDVIESTFWSDLSYQYMKVYDVPTINSELDIHCTTIDLGFLAFLLGCGIETRWKQFIDKQSSDTHKT